MLYGLNKWRAGFGYKQETIKAKFPKKKKKNKGRKGF